MKYSATPVVLALTLGACGFEEALESDPAAWNPSRTVANGGDGTATYRPPAECLDETPAPNFEPTLPTSTATGVSHLAGQPCLNGCHEAKEAGGTAELVLAVGGTIYRAQGQRDVAAPGNTVRSVGGTELTLDVCGNFYAIADALTSSVRNTQPWVQTPIFRRMEKPLQRVANAGDCNQSGCHDFSSRLSSGIYY